MTLRKIEARIKADFKDGLPPHLQPNAKSKDYVPGADQSRIYVSSHSEFLNLHAKDIQTILRERLILVSGVPIDYNYGWDLDSMDRLHDVDKKTNVHGRAAIPFVNCFFLKSCSVLSKVNHHHPEHRNHQGTLRELHNLTKTLSNDECPPLNAISLPAYRRNLYIPPQFGSLATNEVAQSRLPQQYEALFEVPDLKPHMEWSLIGNRGAVSPLHVDSEGLCTAIVVLEGSKYWIVVTRFGEDENVCSVDSLGPAWNPFFINDGDKGDRYRFEGVHLQKGDML